MGKLYTQNRQLRGEELSAKILLHDWVINACEAQESPAEMLHLLKDVGGYFTKVVHTIPTGIPAPYLIDPCHCHHNSIIQSIVLTEEQPEILQDFKFVSGFYGMRAIDPSVPMDKKYFIGHHTFMTYKGEVLDYTVLLHPPLLYEIDQYFGVAFEIQTVVNAYSKFIDSGDNIAVASIFQVLRDEPYILP